MLWKLLVEYLRPHRQLLIAVVIFPLAQSIASPYLPTLNADIIDEGVAMGRDCAAPSFPARGSSPSIAVAVPCS